MKIAKYILIGVIVVGMWRGFNNWADTENVDTSNAIRLFETAVNTIADLTYRWIPVLINAVTGQHLEEGALP